MEGFEWVIEFADNGIIIRPEDFACSVYEYDSDDYSSKANKAIGDEIIGYLHDEMMNGAYYKFKVTINFEPLEE